MAHRKKLLIILVVLLLLLHTIYKNVFETNIQQDLFDTFSNYEPDVRRFNNQEIVLSFYTSLFGNRPWESYVPKSDYGKECGYDFDGCVLNYNKSQWMNADVLFFHARDMPPLEELTKLKKEAKKGQLWLYYILENPYNTPSKDSISHLFELTGSYRANSDFFHSYEYYDELSWKELAKRFMTSKNYTSGKTKQIAWLVSNCGGRREKLAKKFEEFGLHIDVGGACATRFNSRLRCPEENCYDILKKYKFYFAAENNLCEDYITEKYWKTPFKADSIPITLGGSDYSNPMLAIPGSFINALDFESPKELADYIRKVDSDDALYNKYFEWKKYYKIRTQPPGCSRELDDFCTKLKRGIKLRANPVQLDINIGKECKMKESAFDDWINR